MSWIIATLFGNLGKVCDGIWRSGQSWILYPIWLFLGLKTIINLSSKPEKDYQDIFERWFCRWRDIELIEFNTISPDYKFDEAYDALKKAKQPVLVHCEGGKDRSGGLIAVYKREVLGQTLTEIVEDWPIHEIPGEAWLIFLFNRFGE